MRSLSLLLVAGAAGANGLFMVALPELWYRTVPGVSGTGPFNAHFVRDIGLIYGTTGAAFLWLWRSESARPAAIAGAVFLALHALLHLAEHVSGHAGATGADVVLTELLGIGLLAVAALWLALPWRAAKGS